MSNYADHDLEELRRLQVEVPLILRRLEAGKTLAASEVTVLRRANDAVRVLAREVRERRGLALGAVDGAEG